jgi:hypothetical protein
LHKQGVNNGAWDVNVPNDAWAALA